MDHERLFCLRKMQIESFEPFSKFRGKSLVDEWRVLSGTIYIHWVEVLGQRLRSRDADREVAEFQVRVAVMNGYNALSIPVTKAARWARPGIGQDWPSGDLRNSAHHHYHNHLALPTLQNGRVNPKNFATRCPGK